MVILIPIWTENNCDIQESYGHTEGTYMASFSTPIGYSMSVQNCMPWGDVVKFEASMDFSGGNVNGLLMRSKTVAKICPPCLSPYSPGAHLCIRQAVSCFYLPGLAFLLKK